MRRPPSDLVERLHAVTDRVLVPERPPGIDEVAELTGIPRTTLYYYFAGRDALVDFLLLEKVARIGGCIAQAMAEKAEPAARLAKALHTAIETIAAHPALCTVLMARVATLTDDNQLQVAVDRSVIGPLRQLLADGHEAAVFNVQEPEVAAHALYGAISMACLSRFSRDGAIDVEQLAGSLVPQLIASVARISDGED